MARKESVTRKILSEGAFELLKEQGMEMLTALWRSLICVQSVRILFKGKNSGHSPANADPGGVRSHQYYGSGKGAGMLYTADFQNLQQYG